MDYVDGLVNKICIALPYHKTKLEKSVSNLSVAFRDMLNEYISCCISEGNSIEYIAGAYVFMLREFQKEQLFFFRNNYQYRFKRSTDFYDSVYNIPSYMKPYMIGMALSTFLWPQYQIMHSFFLDSIERIECELLQNSTYLEVGSGHGFLVRSIINKKYFSQYTFVDISETGLSLTKRALEEYKGINAHFICDDIFRLQGITTDFLVANQILPCLENPKKFIKQCYARLNDSGYAYISTAFNAPAPDAILNFHKLDDLEFVICDAGFVIETKCYIPHDGFSVLECESQMLPLNVAYLLKKENS